MINKKLMLTGLFYVLLVSINTCLSFCIRAGILPQLGEELSFPEDNLALNAMCFWLSLFYGNGGLIYHKVGGGKAECNLPFFCGMLRNYFDHLFWQLRGLLFPLITRSWYWCNRAVVLYPIWLRCPTLGTGMSKWWTVSTCGFQVVIDR